MFFCSSGFGGELAVDIAPGPLQQALETFSQLTGLQILYDPALVQGRVTRGIKGTMDARIALSKLLSSTDIAFSFTGADAIALFKKSEPSPARVAEQPVSPRVVTVNGDRTSSGSYNIQTSLAATKVDESSLIVPVASQSLTQAILRDRQVNRLQDAIEYVSGSEVAPNGQSALGFQIRGLPTYQYYLDGVRVSPDLHHDGFRDMSNIERIEVIKGPASLLYGRTEPGGAINLVTKQPLTEPHTSWELQTGSFGRERAQLDAGGPVPDEANIFYRLNAAYEDESSFRGIRNRRIFVAPVLNWSPYEGTTTTLYAEFLDSHDLHDSGLPVIGNQLPPVPVTRSLETGNEVHTTDFRVGLKGTDAFYDEDWFLDFHLDGRWTQSPRSPGVALSADGLDPASCNPQSCPVTRELVSIPVSHGFTTFLSVDARGDFDFASTEHSLLVGLDGFVSAEYSELYTKSDPSLNTDLFNPRNSGVPVALLTDPDWSAHNRTAERWAGVYAQDQIQLGDTLYFLLGVRYDYVAEKIENIALNAIPDAFLPLGWYSYGGGDHRVQAVKGRAGFLWHPTRSLSLYANFMQNFGVSPGLYYSGNGTTQLFLPAEIAEQFEIGGKLELAEGRASASVALFDLSKRNISSPVLEPAIDNSSVQYLMNKVHHIGAEADLQGELLPGLQLLASYAYIDSRIDNIDSPWSGVSPLPKDYELLGATGNRLAGVPRHGGSLWTTYRMRQGELQGLKFGFGAVFRGVREGDNTNDYQLPGFAKFSAVAAYGWRAAGTNFSLQLNVDNMFDKRYYESLSGTRTVLPGAPRSWLATLTAEF